MLPKGFSYPYNWPLTYIAGDNKEYTAVVKQIYFDDLEPYYTIDVIEGPYEGERQTVNERLHSYVDVLDKETITKTFLKFAQQT